MSPSLLASLAWFAQIAHHRSFTRAAAQMGITRAALSQKLKALESSLNVRLLHRTTRDVSLTEAGRKLLDAVEPALKLVDDALRGLGKAQVVPEGLLRVNTSRVAARTLIEPHLNEFLALHPGLRLELVIADGFSNIVADGCDAGIRLGQSLAEHVVAVPVSPMLDMSVVATPAYFARHGKPQAPSDLVRHNCLGYRQTTSGAIFRWEFSEPDDPAREFVFEPRGSMITNDDESMIRSALLGVGLIQHMTLAVHGLLERGDLVRVLQAWSKPFPGFYLYVPARAQMPAKTRVFRDFFFAKRETLPEPSSSPSWTHCKEATRRDRKSRTVRGSISGTC